MDRCNMDKMRNGNKRGTWGQLTVGGDGNIKTELVKNGGGEKTKKISQVEAAGGRTPIGRPRKRWFGAGRGGRATNL